MEWWYTQRLTWQADVGSETDLFTPLLRVLDAETTSGRSSNEEVQVARRVVADHARACTALAVDGVEPGRRGAQHVLRRLMRRAFFRAQRALDAPTGLLGRLVPEVVRSLSHDDHDQHVYFFPHALRHSSNIASCFIMFFYFSNHKFILKNLCYLSCRNLKNRSWSFDVFFSIKAELCSHLDLFNVSNTIFTFINFFLTYPRFLKTKQEYQLWCTSTLLEFLIFFENEILILGKSTLLITNLQLIFYCMLPCHSMPTAIVGHQHFS